MRGQATFAPDQLTALARSASNHNGQWPTLSVWHGSSDQTVDLSNAAAVVDQWRGLHGVAPAPTATETIEGQLRRVWRNRDGVEVIEEYVIAHMGHGTPIHAAPANAGEAAGPYMLDVGISSTRRILKFWKLDRRSERSTAAVRPSPEQVAEPSPRPMKEPGPSASSRSTGPTNHVQEVIEKALRSAGLMK
jgi:poly(3-hydroxybutyrate) depolymerase